MEQKMEKEVYIPNPHNELTFNRQSPAIKNAGALAAQPIER
jgi:hypothetical protein